MSKSSVPAEPSERPRTVFGAFVCWVVGAVLTASIGLLMLTVRVLPLQIAGVLLILVGLALGLLADRGRKGDARFARAALGLAMGNVAFMALILLFLAPSFGVVIIVTVTVVLLVAGSVLNQLPLSQRWFEHQEHGRKGAA